MKDKNIFHFARTASQISALNRTEQFSRYPPSLHCVNFGHLVITKWHFNDLRSHLCIGSEVALSSYNKFPSPRRLL